VKSEIEKSSTSRVEIAILVVVVMVMRSVESESRLWAREKRFALAAQ
jgi:hypothetical protein